MIRILAITFVRVHSRKTENTLQPMCYGRQSSKYPGDEFNEWVEARVGPKMRQSRAQIIPT